jgi:Ran GTPase-activating protein (RanGAP) involved in mRNA processing and transport
MRLSTKSIGLEAAPVVVEAIRNVSGTLEVADISDVIAGRPEAEVLQVLQLLSAALRHCRLRALSLSSNALGEKGIRACTEVLTSQEQLEELYLENVGCSVNACKAISELVQCKTLKKVHLFNNMSDNEGAASVAQLLAHSPAMEVCSSPCMKSSSSRTWDALCARRSPSSCSATR